MTMGFHELLCNPKGILDLFLPAMPEHQFFSLPEHIRTEYSRGLYKCPNGHLYSIGDCTRPWQLGKCMECHALIGGLFHTKIPQNERVELKESDYMGYILRSPFTIDMKQPSERMPVTYVAITHFILHTCFLICLHCNKKDTISSLNIDSQTVEKYLKDSILQNLETISTSLAKNTTDIFILLHHVIFALARTEDDVNSDIGWKTINGRRRWEASFIKILDTVFKKSETLLKESQEHLSNQTERNDLDRLIHEADEVEFPSQPTWKDPCMWLCTKRYELNHLLQDLSNRNEGKVTQLILKHDSLVQMKNLHIVLDFQNTMIMRCENKYDLEKVNSLTYAEETKDDQDNFNQDKFKKYCDVWNSMYEMLQLKGPITEDSPISTGLPCAHGSGQAAKVLAEYLIDIQNKFLDDSGVLNPNDHGVKVSKLQPEYIIDIDKERDILPLLSNFAKYDIKVTKHGRKHEITYNVHGLESQIIQNFVEQKKKIKKETLPCIRFHQDFGIGQEWLKLINRQEVLPEDVSQKVKELVTSSSLPDICETVRSLTCAISYLAKAKNMDQSRSLSAFMEKDLLLRRDQMSAIPRSLEIRHTLAMYQWITWYKSAEFVKKNSHPFQHFLLGKQSKLSESIVQKLKGIFPSINLILLQQRLNEIMIQTPDFNVDWSMNKILPDFKFLESSSSQESEANQFKLPDEIVYGNIVHLFELSVQNQDTKWQGKLK